MVTLSIKQFAETKKQLKHTVL